MVEIQPAITVQHLLNRMQYQRDFPAISQHVIAINSKAIPSSNSSATDLATLILKDYSLTSRLLKVANSAMFGEFAGKISTVTRAVVVLGFEQVHLTATGLIFFEHLQDKSSSHYIKEGILSSFLSGILARDLARYSKIENWENYFVAAMFHQFGRLLAMYYFPDEYQNYSQLVTQQLSESQAMEQAFGITFSELGIGIAKSWVLPERLMNSMVPPDPAELAQENPSISHYQGLSAFANELCEITMNVRPDHRREQVSRILEKYKNLYPIPEKQIIQMMDAALMEMRNFSDVLRLDREDLKRLDQRSFHQSSTDSVNEGTDARAAMELLQVASTQSKPLSSSATPEERQQNLLSGIQEITNVMLEDVSLDEVLSMILETIYRGIGFDRVVIFYKDPKKPQMNVRYSLSNSLKNFLKGFSFQLEQEASDLFNSSLNQVKDLYIQNISDTHVRDFKPAWFRGAIFSPSFVLYPICINKKCIGLIYAGHLEAGEHVSPQQLNAIKTLRNQAALAIKQSFVQV